MKKTEIKGIVIPNDQQWIYDLFDIDATSPKKIQNVLDSANGEEVVVEVNSPGGYVTSGSEIYNMLRSYRGDVTIDIVGQAGSAASVIAMARKNRIAPTASIMIHNVSINGISGDYHEMDKTSSTLQELTKSMANAYMLKTGLSRDTILEMMDKETTMEANNAIEQGFVDELIPEASKPYLLGAMNQNCNMISETVISRISKLVNHHPEGADLTLAKLKILELEREV